MIIAIQYLARPAHIQLELESAPRLAVWLEGQLLRPPRERLRERQSADPQELWRAPRWVRWLEDWPEKELRKK
jgi:hypothetical protein